ncbi:PP2C family protein-serine/threonine phosphatase [Mycolicibacterium goodii]|uniref:Serine/threonine protein phosphatase n=1 Tax=Mycolicibacterium goodii TaxID=134601 RepID=A0A0K0X1M2_MYCGD|nr:serine/threonine protein phosphatase [Mycolicibacterium goodii]
MTDEAAVDVGSALDDVWTSAPHPVIVADAEGVIRAASAAARDVLPGLRIGRHLSDCAPWLWDAHVRLSDTGSPRAADGPDGGSARPTPLPGGEVAWWLFGAGQADPTDAGRRLRTVERELSRERERANFLDEVSAVLMASLNADRCMEAIVRIAVPRLADAAVVIAPPTGQRLEMVCAAGAVERRRVDADPATVTGLTEALRGFPPVPSRWIDPKSIPDWLVPRDFTGTIGSVVVTPLPGHGVPAGALVLLRRSVKSAFDGEEVFARLFAARAGAALSAARLYAEQASITRTLMEELLPPKLAHQHGIEIAGGYRAAEDHQTVGGDFYDVHPAASPDDETLVVLGDVCGKGLDAAVLTGKIRNTLQALAPLADDHGRVLRLLNRALLSAAHTRFATLVLASVARRDDRVALRLTSGGHLAPLIVRRDGSVEEAATCGMLVGAVPEITATTCEAVLEPGETCLLYTDGVTEARGGPLGNEMFGEARLAAALAECAGLPAEAVVERIMMLTAEWIRQRGHDDVAVVAITAPRRARRIAGSVKGSLREEVSR